MKTKSGKTRRRGTSMSDIIKVPLVLRQRHSKDVDLNVPDLPPDRDHAHVKWPFWWVGGMSDETFAKVKEAISTSAAKKGLVVGYFVEPTAPLMWVWVFTRKEDSQ